MAKGQQRSNKEQKKPKKDKKAVPVVGGFLNKPKANEPIRK
jgi:hypothetical protein